MASAQQPPVNNGHYFLDQGWSLYTVLTVYRNYYIILTVGGKNYIFGKIITIPIINRVKKKM